MRVALYVTGRLSVLLRLGAGHVLGRVVILSFVFFPFGRYCCSFGSRDRLLRAVGVR
jgi:hypothetical protein